jgi:hypothetical protein
VSKELVQRVKLTTEKHLQPYGLCWIRKVEGAADVVNEVCRVPLSIGKNYQDEIVCDVVVMDACQIFLGRPWQYDVDIGFKGRVNTYEFWWKGKHHFETTYFENRGTARGGRKFPNHSNKTCG